MCRAADLTEIRSQLRARSICRSLRDRLLNAPSDGQVQSVFDRACIIQLDDESLVALVAPDLGNGPLNIVIRSAAPDWPGVHPGVPAKLQSDRLQLGELDVSFDGTLIWEPCPDWNRLRTHSDVLLGRLTSLMDWLDVPIAGHTLMGLLRSPGQFETETAGVVYARTREAAEALWAGWHGDEAQLAAGAAQLAGMGSGLTPAGDDFLLGTMLCAWLAHPAPRRYCQMILAACLPRTTLLSRAFLRSAAEGECGAPWHHFLEAMDSGLGGQLEAATWDVLAFGHTSGADALGGFLWMGLRALDTAAQRVTVRTP